MAGAMSFEKKNAMLLLHRQNARLLQNAVVGGQDSIFV